MEWEMHSKEDLEKNQPKPITQPPVAAKPPLPASEIEIKSGQNKPSQEALSCKFPGFGYFVNKAISVYRNNFWKFLFIMATPSIIFFLLAFLVGTSFAVNLRSDNSVSFFIPIIIIGYILGVFVSFWAQASLLCAIKERDSGMSFGAAFKKGFSKLPSYIGVSLLMFSIIGIGIFLLIIPGIIFAIWYCLSVYVVIDEGKTGMAALRRSKELITGYITAFFGRAILFGMLIFGISFLLSLTPLANILSPILSIVLAPLSVVFSYLIYEEIKKAKATGCKKSQGDWKYALLAFLFFLLIPIGILVSVVLVSLNSNNMDNLGVINTSSPTIKAKDVHVKSYLNLMRASAEMSYDRNGNSYAKVGCIEPDIANSCDKIKEVVGQNPIIHSSKDAYCAYTKLPSGNYYCINSEGRAFDTDTNPGSSGYCDGATFDCPDL